MAAFAERTYQTWRVKSEKSGERQRAFRSEDAAQAHARELAGAGFPGAKVSAFTSTAWQAQGSQQRRRGRTDQDVQDQSAPLQGVVEIDVCEPVGSARRRFDLVLLN